MTIHRLVGLNVVRQAILIDGSREQRAKHASLIQ